MIDGKALLIEIRLRNTNIEVHAITQQLLYYIVLYFHFYAPAPSPEAGSHPHPPR